MDIDMQALRLLERERDISLDVLVSAIEQALLSAYHRTPGAHATRAGRGRPQDRARDGVGPRGRGRWPRPDDERRACGRRPRGPEFDHTPDGLRAHRHRDRPPGHRPAAARRRGRPGARHVPRQGGRGPRRRHPAGPRPAHRARRRRRHRGGAARARAGADRAVRARRADPRATSSRSRAGLRGPQVTLSRTHPNLVRKLFALEVPEVADGTVEITAIAREAGHRTKIAVRAHGRRASTPRARASARWARRVRAVMAELHGEKIDIVDHCDDPAEMSRTRCRRRGCCP